jgi:hypothetical protein
MTRRPRGTAEMCVSETSSVPLQQRISKRRKSTSALRVNRFSWDTEQPVVFVTGGQVLISRHLVPYGPVPTRPFLGELGMGPIVSY